jgi:hypothetical protein
MRRSLAVPFLFVLLGSTPSHASTGRATAEPVLPDAVTTAHFVVHYTTVTGDLNASTPAGAQTLAANAENAYAVEVTSWGYPAPMDDGDGHVDISIVTVPYPYAGTAGWSLQTFGTRAPGTINIDPKYVSRRSVIAHEFFHVVQYGIYLFTPGWASESSARWAEHEEAWGDGWSTAADRGYLSHPEMSFDCQSQLCPEGTWDGGYERWLFWSFLSNRYGRTFVREYYDTAAADKRTGIIRGTDAIDATLVKHRSSLAQAFNDFAVANAARSYPAVAASGTTVKTSTLAARETASVSISHLAARYVEIQPATSSCTAVTLHVRVTAPEGVGAPYVVVGSQANAVTSGVLDLAWLPCGAHPIVVLANTTVNLDAQTFSVATSIGNTPPATTPTDPMAPTAPTVPGAPVPPTASGIVDAAPAISVVGAQAVIRVSSSRPALSLSLSTGGEGTVALAWEGGQTLAVVQLHPGTNTFRVVLPRGLKGRKTLLLTGRSSRGTAGKPLRQAILFVR